MYLKTKVFLLLVVLVITVISCGRNRLRTDEKALVNQILTEEEQLAQQEAARAEREKQLADSIAKLPKGFRFKEDRKVDPNNPPTVIDIIGSRSKTPQKIKLSQLFDKIKYIKLGPLPDSSFYDLSTGIQAGVLVSDQYIYGYSTNGIIQYDQEGKFIKYICKNESYSTKVNGITMVSQEDWNRFVGSSQPKLLNNKLFYRYEDRPAGFASMMEYSESSDPINASLPVQENTNKTIKGLGKEITKLKARKQMTERLEFVPLGSTFVGSTPKGKSLRGEKTILTITSNTGDTVCTFADKDPIKNFSRPVYRGVDDGNSYHSNGVFHLRQAFNDTIYQLVPPSRLIPKYILEFGSMGIQSANEGIDPNLSLKDKLVPQSFIETSRYLFITYSKDYDCPNTAKQGTLKYSRLIYDKKNKNLIPIYLDEKPFLSEGGNMAWPSAPDVNIENDLDAMPFKWPEAVTSTDQLISIFKGEELMKLNVPDLPVKNVHANDRIIAIYR